MINGAVIGTSSLYVINCDLIPANITCSVSADFNGVLNTNVTGTVRVITEFLPLVRKGARKVIITMSSIAGSVGSQDMLLGYYHSIGEKDPLLYAYRVGKAALNLCMWSRSYELSIFIISIIIHSISWYFTYLFVVTVAFAKDHAAEGIIIVPVHPGMVETEGYYDTGAKKDGNPFLITPAESAKQQIALYNKLKLEDTGKFFSYTGEVVPF